MSLTAKESRNVSFVVKNTFVDVACNSSALFLEGHGPDDWSTSAFKRQVSEPAMPFKRQVSEPATAFNRQVSELGMMTVFEHDQASLSTQAPTQDTLPSLEAPTQDTLPSVEAMMAESDVAWERLHTVDDFIEGPPGRWDRQVTAEPWADEVVAVCPPPQQLVPTLMPVVFFAPQPEFTIPPEWATTTRVAMKGIPWNYTADMVLQELCHAGFQGSVESFELATDNHAHGHRGHAILTFLSPHLAWMFKMSFDGRCFSSAQGGLGPTIAVHPVYQLGCDDAGPSWSKGRHQQAQEKKGVESRRRRRKALVSLVDVAKGVQDNGEQISDRQFQGMVAHRLASHASTSKATASQAASSSGLSCPTCGGMAHGHFKFCSLCGGRLSGS